MTRLPPLGTLPLHLGHQKICRKNRLLNAKYSSPLSVFQQCKICTWTIVGFSWLHKTWSGAHWETSRQQDWGTPLSSPKELSLLRTIACHHRRSYHIAKNSNMQKFFSKKWSYFQTYQSAKVSTPQHSSCRWASSQSSFTIRSYTLGSSVDG